MITERRGRRSLSALAAVLLVASAARGITEPAGEAMTSPTDCRGHRRLAPEPARPPPLADSRCGSEARRRALHGVQQLQQVSDASVASDPAALGQAARSCMTPNTVGLQRIDPPTTRGSPRGCGGWIDDINTATRVRPIRSRRDEVDAAIVPGLPGPAVDHLHEAKAILDADLAPGDQRPSAATTVSSPPCPPGMFHPARRPGLGELVAGVRDHGRQLVHREAVVKSTTLVACGEHQRCALWGTEDDRRQHGDRDTHPQRQISRRPRSTVSPMTTPKVVWDTCVFPG